MTGKVTRPLFGSYTPSWDKNVKPGTMLSVIVTFVAAFGPMFFVEIV